MDLDDLMPSKKPSGVVIGENLSTLSVAELEKRITDLGSEIERVRIELDKKRKHEERTSKQVAEQPLTASGRSHKSGKKTKAPAAKGKSRSR